jgi:hypothetical protein
LDGRPSQSRLLPAYWGYEYRSTQIFGWPLIHVAQGMDPDTGRPRVAKGVIAIGNVAIAVYLAIGGLAMSGTYALGGLALAAHGIGALGSDLELARWLQQRFPAARELFDDLRP